MSERVISRLLAPFSRGSWHYRKVSGFLSQVSWPSGPGFHNYQPGSPALCSRDDAGMLAASVAARAADCLGLPPHPLMSGGALRTRSRLRDCLVAKVAARPQIEPGVVCVRPHAWQDPPHVP